MMMLMLALTLLLLLLVLLQQPIVLAVEQTLKGEEEKERVCA
jgi:hypothetical protein